MRVVLKRASALFGVFGLLVALTVGIASTADPGFPNSANRVLLLLVQPAIAFNNWMDGLASQSEQSALGRPEGKDPVLWVHVILGIDALITLLVLYFLVCLILAWCWTWIERRTAPREMR
jgi:hypothetical protein